MKENINQKQNLGILIWGLNNGGAERAAANLSKQLSKKYNVHIMVFDSYTISYSYEGTLHTLEAFPAKTPVMKIVNFFKRCWQIHKCKKENNIQITISFMPACNLYNILTKGKGKVIISIRAIMSLTIISNFWRKIITWCGKKADMTVSVSEMARQDLIKNFSYLPDKVITILNLCDTEALQESNPQIDEITKNFDFSGGTFVTVGRLEYEKAQWHLLRAFSLVNTKYPQTKLVLFGQGSLENSLKMYAQKLGIYKNTFFMGYLKNQHTFLRKCDVFVLPSFVEGISNALLEAMSCGLPIISTPCQCEVLSKTIHEVKTLEEADWGILIPPFKQTEFNVNDLNIEDNDRILAQAMEKLLINKTCNLNYRRKSYERIKDFSVQAITKQWLAILEFVDK